MLLSLYLREIFVEGISLGICEDGVKVVVFEGEVGDHLVPELLEVAVCLLVFALNPAVVVRTDQKHPSLVQHSTDLPHRVLAWEVVKGDSSSNEVVSFQLIQLKNTFLLKLDGRVGVFSHVLFRVSFGGLEHLVADINAFYLLKIIGKGKHGLTGSNSNIQVLLFSNKRVNFIVIQL